MTGLLQSFGDLKLIVSTDRRVWAAAGFVVCVVFVYFATTAWREEDPPPPEEYIRMRLDPFEWKSRITKFNKAMEESHKERKELREVVARASQTLKVQQQEIDWQANELIEKLDTMTDKVDGLINKLGGKSIQNVQRDRELNMHKSKNRRKIPVDRSNL